MKEVEWIAGQRLKVSKYLAKPNGGLSYPDCEVIAYEPGVSGGWDVYDGFTLSGKLISFYGFSVQLVFVQ